jgi:plasmid stabilization system protein ParE
VYKLTVTELADADLDEIVRYIAIELAAHTAATAFLDKIVEAYDRLRANPHSCELSRDSRLRVEGFRRAVVKNYIMLYKVFDDREEVVVYRFFYGGRDYAKLI